MNLYTIVANDEYEFPVKCDLRVKAAGFLGVSTNDVRRMVRRPPKRSPYRVVITGEVMVDRREYEKKYRMTHDRSEYFRERYRRSKGMEISHAREMQ